MTLEWQGFGNSNTVHLIDSESVKHRKSGRKALCGRYPGRTYSEPWFALTVAELTPVALATYNLTRCADCRIEGVES